MTTELTTTNGIPQSLAEMEGMAKYFIQSGVFKDVTQLALAIVKIQAGRELGLNPLYSMQNINVINGKLSTNSAAMGFLVKKSGKYTFQVTEWDNTKCVIRFLQRWGNGWNDIGEGRFTIDDAKQAGLTGNPTWGKYPKAMLYARAMSQGARAFCPDAIAGLYGDEEARSIGAGYDTASLPIVEADIVTGEVIETSDQAFEKLERVAAEERQPAPKLSKAAVDGAFDAFDRTAEEAARVIAASKASKTKKTEPAPEPEQPSEEMCGHVKMSFLTEAKNVIQDNSIDVSTWLKEHGQALGTLTTRVSKLGVDDARKFIDMVNKLAKAR